MTLSSSLRSVLIYSGHSMNQGSSSYITGPYLEDVDKQCRLFQQIKDAYKIDWKITPVKGNDLHAVLEKQDVKTTLLVFPAGESNKLSEAFSFELIEAIKQAFAQGLSGFFTCGSAYWACSEGLWNAQKITRNLALFPITAQGPLFPDHTKSFGVDFLYKSIEVKTLSDRSVTLLIAGGGIFSSFPEEATRVLATYPSKKPAVISFSYGTGRAILSMVHPEYGKNDLYAQPCGEDFEMISASLSSEKERVRFVAELLHLTP